MPGTARLRATWDSLRTSYWFMPTLMAVGTALLWFLVYAVDQRLEEKLPYVLQWIYGGGAEGARELLGVISGSMITVTGVTFSITIVALTLASQQFGPFLLRNFMRDTGNQVVLGTFLSTFLFCLLTLRVTRNADGVTDIPQLCVSVSMVLAVTSLGVLIYFIHHVSVFIQVSNILAVVSSDLREAIDLLFPDEVGTESGRGERAAGVLEGESAEVFSLDYGYLKAVDEEMLMKTAVRHDLVVRLMLRPGDFIGEGDPIAEVWPARSLSEEVVKNLNDALVLGSQRTATQDVEFVFLQMAEIAVRSLSPGINDPFTAMICIDHLGQGLRRMAGRAIPSPLRHADDGTLRVIAQGRDFPEMVDTAFSQIRHYARASAPVLKRLALTIAEVARHVGREEDRLALVRHTLQVRETAHDGVPDKTGRLDVDQACAEALGDLERRSAQVK